MPTSARVIPLELYAVVWQRPLFTPDRKLAPPVVNEPAHATLDTLRLTGTVLTGPLQIALVHDSASDKDVRIHLHDDYQGWTLARLEPRRAVFTQAGESSELVLPLTTVKSTEIGNRLAHDQQPMPSVIPESLPQPLPVILPPSRAGGMPSSMFAATPSTPRDDTAVRQDQLNALKAAVMQRRNRPPANTDAH